MGVRNIMEEKIFNTISKKKSLIWIASILGVLFILFWSVLVFNENHIRGLNISQIEIADSAEYAYSLDEVSWQKDNASVTKNFIKLSGWIAKPGVAIQSVSVKVIFKDMNDGAYYLIPTSMTERTDITEYIGDGKDYKYSGFDVSIPYDKKIENTDYELYVLYNLNEQEVLVPLGVSLKEWKAQ